MVDQVLANGAVHPGSAGHLELRSHPVGARNENRIRGADLGQIEEASEGPHVA